MLILNNIEKLKNKSIGKWQVVGVEDDYVNDNFSSDHNYVIRLSRNNETGAAIVVERTAGEFGYNVSLYYEKYDNVISITPWHKNELKNKDIFLATMQAFLDSHYDKNK